MKINSALGGYLYGAAFLLLIWQAVAVAVDLPIIPAPLAVAATLGKIFAAKLAVHGLYSLGRILTGVLLAVAVGLPLGMGMGYFPYWDRRLSPLVYLTYPIPKIALLPVLMVLFGLGETAKILMIFLIVVFQVMVTVRDSVKSIPAEIYYPLYSLGAGFGAVARNILIPASLPQFFTSLRVAAATAVAVLFFTETFGTQYGMGYFIMDAWMRVDYPEMYAGMAVLGCVGLLLFSTLDYCEYRLCHWRYK